MSRARELRRNDVCALLAPAQSPVWARILTGSKVVVERAGREPGTWFVHRPLSCALYEVPRSALRFLRAGERRPGAQWLVRYGDKGEQVSETGIFDELVVDDWLHIEQMTDRCWHVRLGDACASVRIDRKGKARVTMFEGGAQP